MDSEIHKRVLKSLVQVAERRGYNKVDSTPSVTDWTQYLDLALRKGARLIVIQIRMYGWGGAEVVDARSLFPLMLQFETVRKSIRLNTVKRLVISVHDFDGGARTLAKEFGVDLLTLSLDPNTHRLDERSIEEFERYLA
ncbi:MAG: hypothetical protein ACE5Z5_03140 [Candidatus Bathyarchaeia archaeon]